MSRRLAHQRGVGGGRRERHDRGLAAETLSALAVNPVDFILSDIGMHDVDGYDLLEQVRAGERAAQRPAVPAIAMTAYASAEDRRRVLAGGFQGHIPKPIDPGEFISLVRAATMQGRGERRGTREGR